MITPGPDSVVVVRRHWNDSLRASYHLSDLSRPHWTNVSGGVGARSPRPFVHVYVACDGAQDGEVAHSGVHGPCPHRIKVCVVAKDNDKTTIAHLKALATGGTQMTNPPGMSYKVKALREWAASLAAAEAALTPAEREAKAKTKDKQARQLIARQARAARKANPGLTGTAFLADVAQRLTIDNTNKVPVLTALLETYPPVVALATPLAGDEETGR